jgi:hypothetical protein
MEGLYMFSLQLLKLIAITNLNLSSAVSGGYHRRTFIAIATADTQNN